MGLIAVRSARIRPSASTVALMSSTSSAAVEARCFLSQGRAVRATTAEAGRCGRLRHFLTLLARTWSSASGAGCKFAVTATDVILIASAKGKFVSNYVLGSNFVFEADAVRQQRPSGSVRVRAAQHGVD